MKKKPIRVSPWCVNNLVVYFELDSRFTFKGITCSSTVSFEPEIFPALLLAELKTSSHVTLFANGKGIVTGVRSVDSARTVLQTVIDNYECRRKLCGDL